MAAIHLLSFVGSWNAGGWAADYDLLERPRKIGSLEISSVYRCILVLALTNIKSWSEFEYAVCNFLSDIIKSSMSWVTLLQWWRL